VWRKSQTDESFDTRWPPTVVFFASRCTTLSRRCSSIAACAL